MPSEQAMPSSVLWVEDDPAIRAIFANIVGKAYPSLRLHFVGDGTEALRIAAASRFDLILTDSRHHGMSGRELARALRLTAMHRRTPMILVTAVADPDYLNSSVEESFDAYLLKPFMKRELVDLFGSLLVKWDIREIENGAERPDLDYKAGGFDLSMSDAVAAIAKDVLAMTNSGGGTIVIGRGETTPGVFDDAGVSEERLEQYETSRLNRALHGFLDPAVHVESRFV